MQQIYHPYWEWECYKNGMWRKETKEYEKENLGITIEFTGDYNLYGKAMIKAVNQWHKSCDNFLSNTSINRRAYIGHAACCIELGLPEYLVRQAWWMLTERKRILADNEATKAIKIWEQKKRLENIYEYGNNGAILMEFPMNLHQKSIT